MQEHLAEILKTIPKQPGIYLMKDAEGRILYIGKAKLLASRVRSYFQDARHLPPRTRILVNRIHDIGILTTETEREALILESNFIKKHQPRYNVLLKDDKHYPYLRLTTQETFPRLEVVRRIKKDGATYFGPYTMVKEVRETIRLIYKIFPLRQSKDELNGTRKRRPCLNNQMGRCLAPCAALVSPEDYAKVVQDVILFLKGKNTELIDSLRKKMLNASDHQEYEKATVYRDKIGAVETVFDKQRVVSTLSEDQDIIACCADGGIAAVQMLLIRNGKMIGEKSFRMKNPGEMEDKEILSSFLKQYYLDENTLPQQILLPCPIEDQALLTDCLSEKKGSRVTLEVPVRGKKRKLVSMAEDNARLGAKNEIESEDNRALMLEELQDGLTLKSLPESIEGFDISNNFGDHSVGSMVAFLGGQADKSKYRRFKIRDVKGIDDYAMLREVLVRRYSGLLEKGETLPDLVLIDGGKGHLNVGYRVLKDLSLEDKIDVACIAKGKNRNDLRTDEVFITGGKAPILFRQNSPARFLLQRIRDEAHRFAITYHRKLRGKSGVTSPLENIPGIGKKRRLALLRKFGGLQGIRNASLEDLQTLPGITPSLARKIANAVGIKNSS